MHTLSDITLHPPAKCILFIHNHEYIIHIRRKYTGLFYVRIDSCTKYVKQFNIKPYQFLGNICRTGTS